MASPHVTGVAALWAEQQLQRNGVVDVGTLAAQLRGNARLDRIVGARSLDVGDGLVSAPGSRAGSWAQTTTDRKNTR
jgi:hypothetical protein